MATKRSNKDGDKRRQEHGEQQKDKRVKVTAPHETFEGI